MLAIIPVEANRAKIEEPPALVNGIGTPVIGIKFIAAPIFKIVCTIIHEASPVAINLPYKSGAALATSIPRQNSKKNMAITRTEKMHLNAEPP